MRAATMKERPSFRQMGVQTNRAYIERRHGQEWTQYLGAKFSTVGRVKLYNKRTEAHLDYPLTRLEITLDPAIPYDKINFPTVFCLDDLQMCFEETKATETERFIIDALLQGCGTIDQLGRRTQAKLKGGGTGAPSRPSYRRPTNRDTRLCDRHHGLRVASIPP